MSTLFCTTDSRREAVRAHEGWNGLDFVEVDSAQTTLAVYFLGKAPQIVTKDNVRIEGGRSEKDHVQVVAIDVERSESSSLDDRMLVEVDKPGDYSTYTLRLVGLNKIDPRYASIEFSFKASCPTDVDCAQVWGCESEELANPAIDYLAKDYASYRQLVLDRLALVCPDWRERHVPDLGVALVEVLAYTGDYLSYYQDAVATEAYLDTARRRPSVRRHARLVDYTLSEGCNARALIALDVINDVHFKAADASFITGVNHLIPIGARAALQAKEIEGLPTSAYEVFEPVCTDPEIHLWKANNRISFYTWGARECCLARGATSATLLGKLNEKVHLQPGDFMVFEEVIGPVTGKAGDADPRHRQAVRLARVEAVYDELMKQSIIEIEWHEQDALTFDLCISAIGAAPECIYLHDVSVARGNVILVDHGRPIESEPLGRVPVKRTVQCCECEGQPSETTVVAGRYRPKLLASPITFAVPCNTTDSAFDLFRPDPRKALPAVKLMTADGDWTPCGDLLSDSDGGKHFVVEMEENGSANILFGQAESGQQPAAGTEFSARYRVGNGPSGNVGAGAISLLVCRDSNLSHDIARVYNPLPAQGGTPPEPMTEAKLNAPQAFRYGPDALRRAITPDDYARIAERHVKIQRAAARLVWSGSWYEADVGIDVKAAYAPRAPAIAQEIAGYLDDFRRIGHELNVGLAEYVPIDLSICVCIAPEYLSGHVKAALLDALGNRGFFHPDRLTFGGDIYLSAIVAVAQSLPGVVNVQVTRLQKQMQPANQEIEKGVLHLGPFKIAQLDCDPNHPDYGSLEIQVVGGR